MSPKRSATISIRIPNRFKDGLHLFLDVGRGGYKVIVHKAKDQGLPRSGDKVTA